MTWNSGKRKSWTEEWAESETRQHRPIIFLASVLFIPPELTDSSLVLVRTDHSGCCDAAPSQQHNTLCMSHWHKAGIIQGHITTFSLSGADLMKHGNLQKKNKSANKNQVGTWPVRDLCQRENCSITHIWGNFLSGYVIIKDTVRTLYLRPLRHWGSGFFVQSKEASRTNLSQTVYIGNSNNTC